MVEFQYILNIVMIKRLIVEHGEDLEFTFLIDFLLGYNFGCSLDLDRRVDNIKDAPNQLKLLIKILFSSFVQESTAFSHVRDDR